MTAIEYIKHLYALRYTTYIRRDGKGYYLVDGVEIPEKQFKAMHIIPTVLNRSMDNPDKTRLWLG
jgi:hypothetical protein